MFFFLTKKIVVCTIMKLFWSPTRTPAKWCTIQLYSILYLHCHCYDYFFLSPKRLSPIHERKYLENFACGVQNTGLWNPEHFPGKSGIPLKIGIQNPSSPDKKWNPASKTVLDFLTWGNQEFLGIIYFCLRLSDSKEFLEIPFSNYLEIWHLWFLGILSSWIRKVY